MGLSMPTHLGRSMCRPGPLRFRAGTTDAERVPDAGWCGGGRMYRVGRLPYS